MVRGEVFRIPPPTRARGHEQRGARYAVVVQADEFLGLSTLLVAPTSTSARAASFRPTITLAGQKTRVLAEQTTVVDPERLGRSAGRLDAQELRAVDERSHLERGRQSGAGVCDGIRERESLGAVVDEGIPLDDEVDVVGRISSEGPEGFNQGFRCVLGRPYDDDASLTEQ